MKDAEQHKTALRNQPYWWCAEWLEMDGAARPKPCCPERPQNPQRNWSEDLKKNLSIELSAVVLCAGFGNAPTAAEMITTAELVALCQSDEVDRRTACEDFLVGVNSYRKIATDNTDIRVCVPDDTSADDLRDLVVLVLRSAWDRHDENATAMVIEAMESAFPCRSVVSMGAR